jgi:hypothetical protein
MSDRTSGLWIWTYADRECKRPIALGPMDSNVILASEDEQGPRLYVTPADMALLESVPDLLAACETGLEEITKERAANGQWQITPVQIVMIEALRKAKGSNITPPPSPQPPAASPDARAGDHRTD